MSNSAIVKIENDIHQHSAAAAAARQLPAESGDSPVNNETKPKLFSSSVPSIAGPSRVAVAAAPPNALILEEPVQQNTKKLQVVVPRFSHAVSSQLRPHHQQQRPLRLLGNFHRILRTPTRVIRVVTPSSGGGGAGGNQQCKQKIGTGNCQPAPPAVATYVSTTAPVAATATATNTTTTSAAAAASTTTSSNKMAWKMGVNGKQHWPKVSPSQRAPHIAMSSPHHPSYIIRAQASDGSRQQKPKQQQKDKPNNFYRGDEFQRFVPVKAPSSATTVTASAAAAAVAAPYTVMVTSSSGSSATVSFAPGQAASTSAATTTSAATISGEIAAGDAVVAVMDGTGLRRSQRKAPGSNGGAAGLLTMAGTSTKDELWRNDSGGAVSDVLAAVRPKRMSILNKQLNYADGDESEGRGIVPTGRPSQISVGQQFQAELPEHGDQQKHQHQKQRPQAVQTTASASSSSKGNLVDRDECLWSSTEFVNTKLMELKDLEALHLLNSFSFSQPFALCNLEKFACSNAEKATKWLESMDEQFIELLNKHGKNFRKIAKNLSGEWNGPQAELVQRYYALKSERCLSSNSAQFVRCPHIKILGPPVEASDRRPVARTKCVNCTQKLWRDPTTAGADWRGRRRPPILCPPCELYARCNKERNVPTLRATARNGQQQKAKALAGKKRKTNKKVPPVKKVIVKREIVGKRGECVRKAETGRNSVEREETEQKQQQQQANGAGGEEEMAVFDEFLAEVNRIRRRNDNGGTH
uniref:SANT domain-containing protein n=1 Tax=Globodera pallida TaxID=36090 RepID=A0A183BUU3_GLOPA